jgi:outer membrane receptor for ferrienterochelin and colicins
MTIKYSDALFIKTGRFIKGLLVLLAISQSVSVIAQQTGSLSGTVDSEEGTLIGANISLSPGKTGTSTDENGHYELEDLQPGTYKLTVSYLGMFSHNEEIIIKSGENLKVDVTMLPDPKQLSLTTLVVTGTKTFKRKTESPVIVSVMDSKMLDNLQVCNLSEGLKFQPGLRIETDCQTCNYTQLRMNGLGGGYSQILINGRPIFSPLMSLYGMEQLPVNMIERIEVVRGGGSSLYGSSAIGGTVNVITKVPKKNEFELGYTYQSMDGQSSDHIINGNATVVSENKNAGFTFFLNSRERDFFDANGDNFSEIPKIKSNSIGANFFFLPGENQKLEFSMSNLNEYRFGGEMSDKPAYLTMQSEERTHNIWMGNVDYQINFNRDKSSFISYAAWQNTKRDHYTGIFPDEPEDIQAHLENPPYGDSNNTTWQGGIQLNHKFSNFLNGSNVFTLGSEFLSDQVLDVIESYNYRVDQLSQNLGTFIQSDWEITPSVNLLSGVRFDYHNLVDKILVNPRLSLLYKLKTSTQFRLSYATGFRAPQAFDTDLHIAFAGGGVSRVQLSPDLVHENSRSLSASVNFDKVSENFIFGYTFEGFYTHLNNAFVLENIGADDFGEIFEKRNGQGATVQGLTLELRGNYQQKVQLEAGFTLQNSLFDNPVEYIEEINPVRQFLRTPNDYGYAVLTITPNKRFNANINYVYTGSMKLAHFAGAPEQQLDEIKTSKPFSEVNLRMSYSFNKVMKAVGIELFGGVKNVFNAYQKDFDSGKNRDSNYVYGPSLPRTYFIGIKLRPAGV